jgi:hypothetical protein
VSDSAQYASARAGYPVSALVASVQMKADDSIEAVELRPGVRCEDGGWDDPQAAPQEQWP